MLSLLTKYSEILCNVQYSIAHGARHIISLTRAYEFFLEFFVGNFGTFSKL
jgi:hypothetical protein